MSIERAARPTSLAASARQRGLTLVEILVGVAVGIIGVLAIFQTVSLWTKHTQTTGAGGDAQVAGALALFSIERDLKQAGNGFGQADAQRMGCTVHFNKPATVASGVFAMSPVEIAASSAASGVPNEIRVLYGNSSFFTDAEAYTSASATQKTLTRRGGFRPGDLVVVSATPSALPASADCALIEITSNADTDGHSVDHVQGDYVSFYAGASSSTFNSGNETTVASYPAGAMYDLGPAPQRNTWRVINNRTLVKEDLISGNSSQIADGIVSIKAQYGIDQNADKQISDAEWSDTPPTGAANWTNVLAIRVAVLVRSQQFERSPSTEASAVAGPVTPNPPTWAGGTFAMTNVDGSADSFGPSDLDPNNWRYYRYRVYERVIPLRNMLW